MGRECVEGGVEDRGQVKPKHGAQEKQRPPTFLTSLHTRLDRTGWPSVRLLKDNSFLSSDVTCTDHSAGVRPVDYKDYKVSCCLLVCNEEGR